MNGRDLNTLLAVALACAMSFSYNTCFVPRYRDIFAPAADIALVAGIAFVMALALMAYIKPSLCKRSVIDVCVGVAWAAGTAFVVLSFAAQNAAALAIGAVLYYVSSEWAFILALVASCRLSSSCVRVGLVAAVGVGYAGSVCLSLVPDSIGFAACLVLPAISAAFSYKGSKGVFDVIRQSEPAVVTRIASPRSVFPFSHVLFGVFLLCQVVFGFAASGATGSLESTWGFVFLGAAALVFAFKKSGGLDSFMRLVLLVLIAGLALEVTGAFGGEGVASALLSAASSGFIAFAWVVLARVAARNEANALAIFAWGWSLSEIGIALGANLAVLTTGDAFANAACLLVIVSAAFMLFGLRGFNADSVSEEVALPAPAEIAHYAKDVILAQCAVIAERYGLTPRETEIVELLAHGRNGVRIQEMLVISRNTYKTHIRHIYDKLGVRDQQDIIDMVEAE